MYFIRPVSLETTDGITYWPDGIPQNLFDEVLTSLYQDKNGEGFFISYTTEQISRQVDCGMLFKPYIPLGVV